MDEALYGWLLILGTIAVLIGGAGLLVCGVVALAKAYSVVGVFAGITLSGSVALGASWLIYTLTGP